MLVKYYEIIEDPHHCPLGGYRRLLVNGHTRRVVQNGESYNASWLLGARWPSRGKRYH